MSTNLYETQAEVISTALPEMFVGARNKIFNKVVKPAKMEMIGERAFRIPALTSPGGRGRMIDINGGTWGRGTYQSSLVMTAPTYAFSMPFELPKLADDIGSNSKLSPAMNAFKKLTGAGVVEMIDLINRCFHATYPGKLATASAHSVVGGVSQYTVDSVANLRIKQYVLVYPTGVTSITARNSGTACQITAIDAANLYVTLDTSVASAAATDCLWVEGANLIDAVNPIGMSTPYVFHNAATTGTINGVNVANQAEMRSNQVAVTAIPTHLDIMRLMTALRRRSGSDEWGQKKLFGAIAPETQAQFMSSVQSIAMFDLAKVKNTLSEASDFMVPQDTAVFGGVRWVIDDNQDPTRAEFYSLSDWVRPQYPGGDLQMRKDRNGNIFYNIAASDGAPTATTWFAMYMSTNAVCINPRNGGYISGIPAVTWTI